MPKPIRPPERKSPFLNDGIRRAHDLLKKQLEKKRARENTKTAICKGRKWDQDGGETWVMTRRLKGKTLLGYDFYEVGKPGEKLKDIDIPELVKEQLANKKPVRILDAGAGDGNVLAELKKMFGDKVETHAMSLGTSYELMKKLENGQVDKVHNIAIDAWLPKQEYDFIVSYMGGIMYSHHPFIATLKLAHSLSLGGVALVHTGDHRISETQISVFKKFLERHGFDLKVLNPTQMMITRIK